MKDVRERPPILWTPSKDGATRSQLSAFSRLVQQRGAPIDESYESLFQWSIENPDEFWRNLAEFTEIAFSTLPETVLQTGKRMQDAKWFSGAKLNFAENLIAHGQASDKTALTFWNERGFHSRLSYRELYRSVAQLAGVFQESGIVAGDVVAAFIPNMPEAVIGMLAATSLGAIWTSSSPEFNVQGVLDRFAQAEPKILITADGYYFKGKRRDSLGKVAEIAAALDSLEQVIVIPYTEEAPNTESLRSLGNKKTVLYTDMVQAKTPAAEIHFQQLPAEHPVYIMYSSGTTGAPKCMVHGCIGTLLEHKKELILHTDLRPEECISYRTTTGWMMWNWHISALSVGANLCMYDGDLNSDLLFEMAEKERVSVFGSAAGHVQYLKNVENRPNKKYDLSAMRAFLSTGSTLWPDLFEYAREAIGEMQISSISGGTDIIGCFALGCPVVPVHPGELQARSLGYAVDVFNSEGESVLDEVGELVCTQPFPSMPVYFLNDPDGAKYQAAYFDLFDNIWCHGDAAILHSDTAGLSILGRSDDTLNPGGERFGPAVITNLVETFEGVLGATAVAVRRSGEEKVALFVKTDGSIIVDDAFRERVKQGMINPRYRPHFIVEVPDFPFTRSGKLSNKAIRSVIHGDPVPNISALANPEVLQVYEKIYRSEALN